ncbi:WXG100 family type VII secretion target [Brachybacterium sp. sponge]|uniref:WXG100 family type VII secretion target n=1 Tax=Brachybacterium sp. sponge TaxID=1775432 RepID=UPI0007A3B3F1|nr:hypothetical protein [Brachybacterium sp. sponge]
MGLIGMDTAQGEAHAERLRAAGERLEERHGVLDALVRASEAIWRGPDAERFRADWISGASQLLREQCTALEAAGTLLDEEAEQQETASQGERGDGASGGSRAGSSGTASGRGRRAGGGGDGKVSQEVADAWAAMDPPEQKRVLREIAAQELERQGVDDVPVFFDDLSEDGALGFWYEFDIRHPLRGEHIQIDENHVSDPDSLNTVAHEARHAAQDNWVEETDGPPAWQFWREDDSAEDYERIEEEHGVTQEEIEAWRENDRDYEDGPTDPQPPEDAPQSEKDAWNEEYEAYREQPLEDDAFDEGDEFAEDITLEELQQYQLDAGVPVIS